MNTMNKAESPAKSIALEVKADFDLTNHGLTNLNQVYWNLLTEPLYEESIFRGEGVVTKGGALVVKSGIKTARSALDKFIVKESSTEDDISWGEYNIPFDEDKFNEVFSRVQAYLQGKDVFVQDCFAGADSDYTLPIRVITEWAWHSIFARNAFILPKNKQEYQNHVPEFTVIAVPSFIAFEPIDGTRSSTFIIVNFAQKLVLIGNSGYGGEIKKSIFSVMNYLLPKEGVLTMHCSANQGEDKDDVALFFGLSGTGKTTLSADETRGLIGDDEHGWSEDGIFNFEGGCYAKVIRLSETAEPQIYSATHRFGTILENVIYDPVTREIDLDDNEITENTRASYPLEYISNSIPEKKGGHPRNIILLTCDAQGVMPPIAKLTPNQALYHFISGYTSKVGGTEVGIGDEPKITFSACFGAPFMAWHPAYYAELLKTKIEKHNVNCWLLNTGWVGGSYGVGERISIKYTRALLNAALTGDLLDVEYYIDPVFGFEVPISCPNVPEDVMYPAKSWPNEEEYWSKYRQLAARYVDNFKKYQSHTPAEVVAAGPKINKNG